MIILILKGFIIGFFMLFPGLSGGSIAILLGEYDNIIVNTSNLLKNTKNSLIYLFSISVGGIIGAVISSSVIGYFTNNFYDKLIYFFLGIMIVFIVNFLYENTNNKFRFKDIILILLGIIISVFINYIPSDIFNLNSIFSLFVFGLLVAVALILPGISVSYILLIFSCYDNIIYAIKNFDFLLLIRIGFFVIIGIILTIKLIENALIKYKKNTNLIISGFMIGSFYTFIKIPATIFLINEMVIFLMIGILFFLIFDKIIKK